MSPFARHIPALSTLKWALSAPTSNTPRPVHPSCTPLLLCCCPTLGSLNASVFGADVEHGNASRLDRLTPKWLASGPACNGERTSAYRGLRGRRASGSATRADTLVGDGEARDDNEYSFQPLRSSSNLAPSGSGVSRLESTYDCSTHVAETIIALGLSG
ncbi:hypothetical protein FKP32DRAFT_1595527 [Trametes sanguinea]|nr:hypothetical protein FKP32DRAFT_1595527 [Trametes sanguinea]